MLYIAIMSVSAYAVLFILTKIMGNREMSQLCMFDYINGITIGSIAAEMATALEDDFREPLLAMCIFAALSLLTAVLTNKSIIARRIFTGKPTVLYENGKLYRKNLAMSRLDVNEFLTQCRINGYFDLSDIHTAILEPNGKISFLPQSNKRPAAPADLNLNPQQTTPNANVIIDGRIMKRNLKHTGNNENWLKARISALGAGDISDIYLATCDCNNQLTVYKKIEEKMTRDIFL